MESYESSKDLKIGISFGRLTIKGFGYLWKKGRGNNRSVICSCTCGKETEIFAYNFGKTKSCGCINLGVSNEIIQKENETNTKQCSKCLKFKPRDSFYKAGKNKVMRHGVQSRCKECIKNKNAEDDNKAFSVRLLAGARSRAKRSGLEFDLDIEWLNEKLSRGICEITNIKFDFIKKEGDRRPFVPSLDRRDSSKGYTKENTDVVIWWYNMAKGDLPEEAVKSIILKVSSNL